MGQRGPGAKPVRVSRKPGDVRPKRIFAGTTRAERVIEWVETLTITKGPSAGSPLILREWQRSIIRDVYRTGDDDRRIVRTALVTMARKNGKTQLAAALALAHLCGPEAEPRGEVYSAAADRNQASLIYKEMKEFVLADAELAERIIIRDTTKSLEDAETGSTYWALSSDAKKAHGLSPSFYVVDELAQWPNRELFDALATATGARAEPLGVVISTQSADPNHVMSELVHYGQQIIDGTFADPEFSAHIFTVPLGADPWDEAGWYAANPALGDFRSLDEMRSYAQQAQRMPSKAASFQVLFLNQPVQADHRFIHWQDWDAMAEPFDPASLKGQRCIAGLDLSSAADLTGLALYFPDSGHLLAWGFLPAADLDQKEHTDRAPYTLWQEAGHIITTPGRAINKAWVAAKLRELADDYQLEAVAYDRWRIKDLEVILDAEGISLPLVEHGQGYREMGPSVEQFERLVLEGRLLHGGNPLLRWALSNVAIDTDPAGSRKPAKDRGRGRIDPLVAAVMAIGLAARQPATPDFRFTGMVIAAE